MGGVCGMGMAPLAAFLSAGGNEVCGFDDAPREDLVKYLSKNNVDLRPARDGEQFDETVISTALKRRDEEISKKISCKKILLRGQKWAEICAKRKLCAIVGSHGKSSASAMAAFGAMKLSDEIGYLVGALPKNFEPAKFANEGNFVISEIDESDGTIDMFEPEICVALNSDLDHVDTYANAEAMRQMFLKLFSRTKSLVIIPSGDPLLAECAGASGKNFKLVDISKCSEFRESNALMARAALESIFQKNIPENIFEDFAGIKRRQEILFDSQNFLLMSDYAHHPREVSSFLEWFAKTVGEKNDKKIVVFQPHRYTRTKRFAREFAKVFSEFAKMDNANLKFYIMPVYPASETFDAEGQSAEIFKFLKENHAWTNSKETNNALFEAISAEELVNLAKTLALKKENGKTIMAFVGAGDAHFHLESAVKNFFNA